MPIVLLGPGQADIQDDFPGMYGLVTALWLDGCCHQSRQSTRAGNPPEQAIHQSRQFVILSTPLLHQRIFLRETCETKLPKKLANFATCTSTSTFSRFNEIPDSTKTLEIRLKTCTLEKGPVIRFQGDASRVLSR